jgi:hypothetical protein
VLTDKSGFGAKGYDGLATSPEQIAQDYEHAWRRARRTCCSFIRRLVSHAASCSASRTFRGYIQGDLLYSEALLR